MKLMFAAALVVVWAWLAILTGAYVVRYYEELARCQSALGCIHRKEVGDG